MAIQSSRIRALNDRPPRSPARHVLYWMQASQRAEDNHALEFAVEQANEHGLPLVCCFGLTDGYPEANARHYRFMLEGLADVAAALDRRGVRFVLRRGDPDQVALDLSRDAAVLVCDRGYLKVQKRWRAAVAADAGCRVVQVESDVVVPAETASGKHEFAARTLRPKIQRAWDEYLQPVAQRRLKHRAPDDLVARHASEITLDDPDRLVAKLKVDHAVAPVARFRGGAREAKRRLEAYLADPFAHYGRDRGRPEAAAASHMSPYLHFGQIAPIAIALAVREAATGGPEDRSAYLEELIVRRELSINHVLFEERYDSLDCIPDWCRKTLDKHRRDRRPFSYDAGQLAAAETHDRHWNAGMREMRDTGYMHNHMRMYWGKKIIEWTRDPEEAFETTLALNNRYFLDGRDANSFTNVAWLFGLHDRPWKERPVFGTVRYLGAPTLKKFDADAYVEAVDRLVAAEKR